MSEAPSCDDCEYMSRKRDGQRRCYSPQLINLRFPGMITAFERDATQEDGRDTAGTRKCMPEGLNFKRRESV